jgi:membrane protease subunit HflC
MKSIGPALAFIFATILGVGYFSFFIVPEGQQAVVLQFGKIIPPAHTDPGFYFKFPWRTAQLFEKRILNWDGQPNEINTREKNNIIIDTTARYRIVDPIKLRRTFVDMVEVDRVMREVIRNATNIVVANNDLVETVRNTNDIIDRANKIREELRTTVGGVEDIDPLNPIDIGQSADALDKLADYEIAGELETIKVGRENLTREIADLAAPKIEPFGIELVDIQLKRVALEKSVEENVFTRMITEREKIVALIRAVGARRREEIQGETAEKLQKIQSGAYKQVQEIKGKAEMVAIKTYADAISKDPEFYDFYRSLDAYRNGIGEDANIILSADAEFMKFLTQGPNLK